MLTMETLREFIAVIIFIIASITIFLIIDKFDWLTLITALSCYVIAYTLWPSKKRGYREETNAFLNILEFIIEFPIEIFMWLCRLFGRVFRNKDGGVDIDLL